MPQKMRTTQRSTIAPIFKYDVFTSYDRLIFHPFFEDYSPSVGLVSALSAFFLR
jgi:hypothetical protein